MVDYLLDTNVVSFALRGRAPSVVERLRTMKRERVGVSVITAMELRFGVARNPTRALTATIERFLQTMIVLAIDPSVAPAYGTVRAELERVGKPIGALDTIIAAHAIALDATLVTNNLHEFVRVPGLRCEDWT